MVKEKVETARNGICNIKGKEISFPAYIPEIKGEEDWVVFYRNMDYLPEKWPIMVQAGFLRNLMSSIPSTFDVDLITSRAILERHFILYEPMEIYSFKLIYPLLNHSFYGSLSTSRNFPKRVREKDKEAALSLIPPFERKFIEAVWAFVEEYYDKEAKVVQKAKVSDYRHLFEGVWSKIDLEYMTKLKSMMLEAQNLKSTSFIPPVPLLKSTSSQEIVQQVVRMNRASGFLASGNLNIPLEGGVTKVNVSLPWHSLYIDSSCFRPESDEKGHISSQEIIKIVRLSFNSRAHIGISLTINGIEHLKTDLTQKSQLLKLIEDLDDFAFSRGVPLFIPRSGYYGMELIDYGVEFFGSILNGRLKYSAGGRTTDENDKTDKYGITAVYDVGDLNFVKLEEYLQNNGELPHLGNLPNTLPNGAVLNDSDFRINFSKPRRIATHVREVKEIANAIKEGSLKPAFNYLTRIQNAGVNQYI